MSDVSRKRIEETLTLVDHYVAEQCRLWGTPGIVAAIAIGAEPLFLKAYGQANLARGEPMRTDQVFRIASHSKMFTAVACMTLVQQRKMRLDDTVGQYVEGLPEALRTATIRQLLNHTAGVIRDGLDANYWQLSRSFPDGAELLNLSKDIVSPNELFKYSNIGYSLVGQAIAKAAAMPYNRYVREAILDPLGMDSTGPDTDGGSPESLATGYTGRLFPLERLPVPDVPTGAMSPATGFYSTASDLLRFAAANHLGDETVLTDASKREMQQPYWEVKNSDERYGLGFCILKVGERRIAGHGGAFPGHATRTWFDAKERLTVVVLTNATGGPAGLLGGAIFRTLDKALSLEEKRNPDGIDPDRFTGQFVSIWGITEILRLGNQLYATTPSADDPMTAASKLEVVDNDTLRISEDGGYGSARETVRFIRDRSGRAIEVIAGGQSSYPIDVLQERFRGGLNPPDTNAETQ